MKKKIVKNRVPAKLKVLQKPVAQCLVSYEDAYRYLHYAINVSDVFEASIVADEWVTLIEKRYPEVPWTACKQDRDYPREEMLFVDRFIRWYVFKYQPESGYSYLKNLQFIAVILSKMGWSLSDPVVQIMVRDLVFVD